MPASEVSSEYRLHRPQQAPRGNEFQRPVDAFQAVDYVVSRSLELIREIQPQNQLELFLSCNYDEVIPEAEIASGS